MNRLRLAAVLVAALPLAGCGNKGPLTLAPQTEAPPPTPAQAASEVLAEPPSTSTVSAPPDPVDTPVDVELRDDTLDSHDDADATPTPPEESDGTSGTPR
jgi:predicted small lipoprotein YifL